MKEIKLYQCEICGTQFKFSTDAKACEKYHQRAVEILDMRFTSRNHMQSSPYPHTISVKMEDGKVITFRG